MSRIVPSLLIGLLGVLAALMVACDDGGPSEPAGPPAAPPAASPADGPAAEQERPAEAPPAPSAADEWVLRAPPVSFIFVGNQRGKLKPCGCSEPQLGGLERLATLVEQCRLRCPDGLALLSLGWTLSDTAESQAEEKAALYRAALDLLGAEAILLGSTDLFSPALAQPFPGGEKRDCPAPPGNARLEESGPLAAAVDSEPMVTFDVAGLAVRAASILDPDGANRLRSVVSRVLPPAGAFSRLQPRPDTLWLVSTDASEANIRKLADTMKRLGPAVIVDFGGSAGRDRIEDVPLEDGPYVVSLANLGKEVGILDLERAPEAEGGGWLLSYHAVPLEPWRDTAESRLREQMTALFEVYREQVRSRGYLAGFETYPAPDGIGYVGSARCARCHPGIYEDWLRSPHARALQTLREKDYHWDPECIRCHVVGFLRFGEGRWGRIESGFLDPERSPHLGGVGCENCHGPGAAHVESPHDSSLFGPGGPNRRDLDRRACEVCHDVENSHGFPEHYADEYRPRVDHRHVPSDRRLVEPEDD